MLNTDMNQNILSRWLTPTDVALPTSQGGYAIAKNTQAQMRMKRTIPFCKFNSFIRYDRLELDAWITSHTVVSA